MTSASCQPVFAAVLTVNQTLSTLKPLCVAVKYYSHIERTHFIPLRWWMLLPLGTDILVSFLLFDLRLPLNWNGSRKRCQSVAWRLLLFSITCRQSCIRLRPHRWFMSCPDMILLHFYTLEWFFFLLLSVVYLDGSDADFHFSSLQLRLTRLVWICYLKPPVMLKYGHWSNLWLDNVCLMVSLGFRVCGRVGVPNTYKWLMLDLEGWSWPMRRGRRPMGESGCSSSTRWISLTVWVQVYCENIPTPRKVMRGPTSFLTDQEDFQKNYTNYSRLKI